MRKEEEIKREACEVWVEIDKLITKTRSETQAATRDLEELNKQLPKKLLGMAMGTISREEVKALKAKIAELRETLSDAPIILQELEREKKRRCLKPLQDACLLSRDRGEYIELKERLVESFEPAWIDALRRYAREIDEEEDCEVFLSQLNGSAVCNKM